VPSYLDKPVWKLMKDQRRTSPDDLLSTFEIRLPPVDPEYIAQRLGVIIRRFISGEGSGRVESTPTEATVYVNRSDHPVRQRFTIAHELGHLMLHPLGKAFRDTTFSGNWQETQANRFAADLLMPEWMLDIAVHSTGGNVERLARLFGVSEQAMRYRLENTGR
jgi:Zn-dependent peptidase ImmA (M78 family)